MEAVIRGYHVIVEQAGKNWSAYSPDLPGCITTGPTFEQTLLNMDEAIDFHIEGLELYGYPVPPPSEMSALAEPLASHRA